MGRRRRRARRDSRPRAGGDAPSAGGGRAIDLIVAQTAALDRLIGDLPEFSRLASGGLRLRVQPVDPVAMGCECAEEAQATSDRHVIRVEAPEQPLIGSWDAQRLGQVSGKLLGKTIKYSPNGGAILVRMRRLGAESDGPGQGATFVFTLPLGAAPTDGQPGSGR